MTETQVGSINDFGMCDDCQRPNTGYKWCNQCNAKRFKNDFVNWSSDNEVIDGFIQETQLKAKDKDELIEWIPFEKFTNVEYLTKGGFGKVFKATWSDGFIKWWDRFDQKWIREDVSRFPGNDLDLVCLKSIDNSAYVTREFFQEIENQLKFRKNDNTVSIYGITKDPKLKDYMLVLEYARKGSLRKMLDQHFKELGWEGKLKNLLHISDGLSEIHKAGLVHKDFHSGNIVMSDTGSSITDFGLCKPLLQDSSQNNNVFGVLPYVAPEVLRGKNYTQASDVYSFGIIMMEVITGFPPFYDFPHDGNLAISICEGHRPKIERRIPQLLSDLIDQCLDADPTKRLSSEQLKNTLDQYYKDVIYEKKESIIYKQVESCPSYDPNYDPGKFSGISYVTHPEAIYTSRLLSFGSLPNPVNVNTSMAETKQLELVIPNFLEDMTNTSEEDEV